jgi:hypothetical protein
MNLAAALQIQFPSIPCANGGLLQVRANRPGTTTYNVDPTQTIYLDSSATESKRTPKIIGEIPLNQKYQTNEGTNAYDAVTLTVWDTTEYSGKYGDGAGGFTPISETFASAQKTFCGVFFNQKGTIYKPNPYWMWVTYIGPQTSGPIYGATIDTAGTGYAVGDTGFVSGIYGASGSYRITSVGGSGAVTGFTIINRGSGYIVASGTGTSVGGVQPGVGNGFKINITAIKIPDIFFCGTYDALNKVQPKQWLQNPGTSKEALIYAERVIQIVSIESLLQTILWRDVLALIGHDDCAQGDFYSGFCQAQQSTDIVESGSGSVVSGYHGVVCDFFDPSVSHPVGVGPFVAAVPYLQVKPQQNQTTMRSVNCYGVIRDKWDQYEDGSHDPGSYSLDNTKPWPSQRGYTNWQNNPIGNAQIVFSGAGYAVNDTFSISGGSTLAVGKVTTVSGGVVTGFTLNSNGADYSINTDGGTFAPLQTTALTGSGSGLTVQVIKLLQSWGPWGTWGISFLTLLQKATTAMGFETFSSGDLVSALHFYPQVADVPNKTFPVSANSTFNYGPVGLDAQWVSLNALTGSHPMTGGQVLSGIAMKPTTPVQTLIDGISTLWLVDYYVAINQSTGAPQLKFQLLSASTGSIPTAWVTGKNATETPPSIGTVSVTVSNTADSPGITAPFLPQGDQTRGQSLSKSVPWRLQRIGPTIGASWQDAFCLNVWDDSTSGGAISENVFRACWFDFAEFGTEASINNDVWKALTGVYIYTTDAVLMGKFYPSLPWLAFDSNNVTTSPNGDGYGSGDYSYGSFMILSAEYPVGVPFVPGETNYDRFNTKCLQAVTMATYLVPGPSVLQRNYIGVMADDFSLSGIKRGIQASWPYDDGTPHTFRAIEITRHLISGTTPLVRLQDITSEVSPDLSSMPYGVANASGGSGSTTSSLDSFGGGGSNGGTNTSTPEIGVISSQVLAAPWTINTDNWTIVLTTPITKLYISTTTSAGVNLSGIAATNSMNESVIICLINTGSYYINLTHEDSASLAANRFHLMDADTEMLGPNGVAWFTYDTALTRWRRITIGG